MTVPSIGKVGLWSFEMRFGDKALSNDAVAELEELGFGALWIPGGIDDGALPEVERLLGATSRMTIATGILNIWKHEPAELAAWFLGLSPEYQARTLLGLGISHAPLIGDQWGKPVEMTKAFLDGLFAANMPKDNTCIGALGPKMLELSAQRTAGAHPYLVTPEHTAEARALMGAGVLLAPEQGVIIADDKAKGYELARTAVEHYTRLPNYRNNWKRSGFSDAEIDAIDDRLLDAIFAIGSVECAAERAKAHLDAGADHVCLQVILGPQGGLINDLLPHWRALAKAIF